MNGIASGPLQSYSTLSPSSPLGKPAVGLESPASKDLPVAPVEAMPAAVRNQQRLTANNAQEVYERTVAAPIPAAVAVQAQLSPAVRTGGALDVPVKTSVRTAQSADSPTTAATRRRLAAAFGEAAQPGAVIDQRV